MKTAPLITMLLTATLLSALAHAAPNTPFAKKTADGKTLVISDKQQAKGTIYYALSGRDRQVYFESDAPIENIKGQSNAVVGFAVLSKDKPGALAAGEWHLPIKSMKTGIKTRDEHMAGKDWLDAELQPDIVVQVLGVEDLKETKKSAAFSSYTMTLVADLSIHGVTRKIKIPDTTVTLLNESEATRKIAPGNLMAVRAKFEVTLADYKVSHPVVGSKVARTVSLDVSLYHSTTKPK